MIKTLFAVAVLVTVMAIQRVPAQMTDAQERQALRGMLGNPSNPPPASITSTNATISGTGTIGTLAVTSVATGGVSFTVSVDTTTNSAGAAIKVLKLTP